MLRFLVIIVKKPMSESPFKIEPSWQSILCEEWNKPYIASLSAFLKQERTSGASIYPPEELVLNAFWQTPFQQVKVVIVGQDPYHGPGQAHGLAFSVPKGVAPPPSLKNIFKELVEDTGIAMPEHGCLLSWAQQGVLLLNATLTVNEGSPLSHHGQGWELFTDAVIAKLCERQEPLIFVLWGNNALKKVTHIDYCQQHLLLKAAHPSPLAAYRGFFGCRHFSKINTLLIAQHQNPIDWQL